MGFLPGLLGKGDGATVELGALETRTRKKSFKTEIVTRKRAQRIPSWPGVTKAVYICADQPVTSPLCACGGAADHTFRVAVIRPGSMPSAEIASYKPTIRDLGVLNSVSAAA